LGDSVRTGTQVARTLFASQIEDDQEQREDIDFKMVTFSLGGKDYGIDIMSVKEIAKFDGFTYVPNTQPFVTGVYNLRGDIISVIDMRVMFNLPAEQLPETETQDGLILRLESGLIGVVVDRIDKVVGISSKSIQPPHPIFADINLKYIHGVVEHDGRLYIILDTERILGDGSEDSHVGTERPSAEDTNEAVEAEPLEPSEPGSTSRLVDIAKTLETLNGFVLTDLNRQWVAERLEEWNDEHANRAISTPEEADAFLAPFQSPYTGRFWEGDYLDRARELLPEGETGNLNVWNPGCGKGYESYSVAAVLYSRNPDARLKVWASDNDLINISTAPNLVLDERAVPVFYRPFLTEGTEGYTIEESIRTSILFEFSDIANVSTMPPAEIVVIRDLLSYLPERVQKRVLGLIVEQATDATRVISGNNEDLSAMGPFRQLSVSPVRLYAVG
jgi:purine-binding chemotaxis protein CheW